jgi:multiple sugar transport system ATP-binding protein
MTAPGLELKDLTKSYGANAVVDGVSLEVAEGEMLVLVGPSGSGKSTLLRLIAGLIPHDAGQIAIAGRDIGRLQPDRRDIAMVFQSYALFPHLTIHDNLAFGMQARGEPKARISERIGEVSDVLGLRPLLARYPRQLSGGERQRVALGRAMLREPKLFLMDEPLSNLDAQLRVQTRAEILRLHARLGTTTVYVTHDQIEALSMGDRIGVLRGGRLEQLGTPEEIYRRPRSLFVARFVGSPPMNALPVEAAPPDRVLWQGTALPVPDTFEPGLGAAGRKLVLGVRPEHVFLRGSRWAVGEPPADPLSAMVEVVESAGDQIFLILDVEGTSLVARAEPEFRVHRGQRLDVWFHTEALHLFDAGTELALASRQPS